MDNKRVGDLHQLGNAVRRYHTRNGELPKSVAAISDERLTELSDPETGEPYTYRVTGERSFQLCAVFASNAEPPRKRATYGRFKTYEQGFYCFDQEIEEKSQ